MTRQQGFARGDFDTSFPLDDKFLELRGSLDPLHYYAAAGVYWHVLAAGWREAERKPGARTTPDAPDLLAELIRVGLLDSEGRLKVASFRRWVGRALGNRKSETERRARNRTGVSRGTTPDNAVVPPLSSARARSGHAIRDGQDTTDEGGAGGFRPIDPLLVRDDSLLTVTPLVNEAWVEATGLSSVLASPVKAQEVLVDSCRRHPEGKVIAAIYAARDQYEHIPEAHSLAFAVRNLLDPFVDPKVAQKAATKAAAQADEQARSQRARDNTMRTIHSSGGHNDRHDPRCPDCARAA